MYWYLACFYCFANHTFIICTGYFSWTIVNHNYHGKKLSDYLVLHFVVVQLHLCWSLVHGINELIIVLLKTLAKALIVHKGVVSLNTSNFQKTKQNKNWMKLSLLTRRLALNYFKVIYFLLTVPLEARKFLLVCWKSVTILFTNGL